MTLNELQRWILNQNQEDTWWVAVDGDVQDNVMALPDVGKIKDQYPDNEVSVLHATKAEDEDADWIIFEKEPANSIRVVSNQATSAGYSVSGAPAKSEPPKSQPKQEVEPVPEPLPPAPAAPAIDVEAYEEKFSLMQAEINALKLAVAKLNEDVAEMKDLADDLKQPLSEAKAILEEREQFLEMSESSLFEKAQRQEVMQNELEQMREELDDKQTSLKAREKALAEKEKEL